MEEILLEYRFKLEELITEREGMIAENTYTMTCEGAVLYDENSFTILRRKFEGTRNRMMNATKENLLL